MSTTATTDAPWSPYLTVARDEPPEDDGFGIVLHTPPDPAEATALRETCAHFAAIRQGHAQPSINVHGPSVALARWALDQSQQSTYWDRGVRFCNVGTDAVFGSVTWDLCGVRVSVYVRPGDEAWSLFAPHLPSAERHLKVVGPDDGEGDCA